MRYLSEGNYEEAVIAFTAAIEIDPKRPESYIGLSDAHVGHQDYTAAWAALEQGISACGEDGSLLAAREGLRGMLRENKYQITEDGRVIRLFTYEELKELPADTQSCFYLTAAQREERLRPLIPALQEQTADLEDAAIREMAARVLCVIYQVLGETDALLELRAGMYDAGCGEEWNPAGGTVTSEQSSDTSTSTFTSTYDAFGNRVRKDFAFTYKGDSRTSVKSESELYEYGADGRLLYKANDSRETLTYDFNEYDNGKVIVVAWDKSYTYDSEGRLASVTEHRTRTDTNSSGRVIEDNYVFTYTYTYTDGFVTYTKTQEGSEDVSVKRLAVNQYGWPGVAGNWENVG